MEGKHTDESVFHLVHIQMHGRQKVPVLAADLAPATCISGLWSWYETRSYYYAILTFTGHSLDDFVGLTNNLPPNSRKARKTIFQKSR